MSEFLKPPAFLDPNFKPRPTSVPRPQFQTEPGVVLSQATEVRIGSKKPEKKKVPKLPMYTIDRTRYSNEEWRELNERACVLVESCGEYLPMRPPTPHNQDVPGNRPKKMDENQILAPGRIAIGGIWRSIGRDGAAYSWSAVYKGSVGQAVEAGYKFRQATVKGAENERGKLFPIEVEVEKLSDLDAIALASVKLLRREVNIYDRDSTPFSPVFNLDRYSETDESQQVSYSFAYGSLISSSWWDRQAMEVQTMSLESQNFFRSHYKDVHSSSQELDKIVNAATLGGVAALMAAGPVGILISAMVGGTGESTVRVETGREEWDAKVVRIGDDFLAARFKPISPVGAEYIKECDALMKHFLNMAKWQGIKTRTSRSAAK